MKLSIITINYKKPDLTILCMNSLFTQFADEFDKGLMELIIVDNASRHGSVKVIGQEITDKKNKNVRLIENKENLGFAHGSNTGAKSATGDILLFLNNDTKVLDKGILDMAYYLQKNPQIAIIGGKMVNPDGSEQVSVGKFYTPLNAFLLLVGAQKYGIIDRNPANIVEADWVKGGLLMIRRDVFVSLNGFDEKIFMYVEDMELCYRAKIKGMKTVFYPFASVVHKDQGSSDRTFAIVNIYESLLYFYKKHRSKTEYKFIKFLLKTKALILIIIGKLSGNSYLTSTYEKAFRVA